jgi:hypothetical protein
VKGKELIRIVYCLKHNCAFPTPKRERDRVKSVCVSVPTVLMILILVKHTVHNCRYNRFPEDESSGSKHVEDKKIEN